jgi:hypothetical protein
MYSPKEEREISMACKYLGEQLTIISGGMEVGGSLVPTEGPKVPYCKANRNPTGIGWQGKCQNTDENGPCWRWIEVHGERPDPRFAASTNR